MPDRIIRDELLESERWLTLKDNADRLAFFALLLRADSLGNFSGEPYRLMRLWRDFGINTRELVAKTLTELVDHDLVRIYDADSYPQLLHIPRFGQRNLRYIKRVYPLSPWTTNEQKQKLEEFSQRDSNVRTALAHQREEKIRREPSAKASINTKSVAEGLGVKVKPVYKENTKEISKNKAIAEAVAKGDIRKAAHLRNT